MKDISPESLTLLATSIAIEISAGKSIEEISIIKNLTNQISASLGTILSQKIFFDKKEKK